ncbi:acetoin dehydrogenase E2 subunit dihydrolipoyllysine-residue acetyltransferase [Tritonibacter multivorans]|uniref:Acetoin dehydrogenase E2 subunit dihydrolipoyllysine-residue acetyltransferase n=1 Tax=Tritonibacter multivorans TaxID=928856 RepID=A0A0N7M136_9RHOB|nr:alpha/beta hydrolase [Tritonibacter multivorans]MDA7421562.1 alpha/beta hydrolase [Tritonibacter multivorans]CUH82169.1 acetoin dehydrogenase E2 subunit dihydrolipoyllysine-residue acetyltransferase [Tritonibacter multivorans]SFC95545.1 Pimeloyl-ACP methyl ester carboxylesterase [Tritonibacter multivorans]
MRVVLAAGFAASVGAALTVSVLASQREARVMAAYPPEGQFLDLPMGRIHVVERGQPQGTAPDLVLIHGSNGSTRDMSFALAPALEDRYRILMFDRPGLGYSDPLPAASLAAQAHVLQQAAAAMGADRPLVLGQSYGGAVALAWAVHHPDHIAGVISVSGPSHPWDTPLDPLYRLTSGKLGAKFIVPLLTAFVSDAYARSALAPVYAPQAVPDGYAEHFGLGMSLRRSSWRNNARQRADLLSEIQDLQPHYRDLTLPIEIIHGTADVTVSVKIHGEKLIQDTTSAHLTRLEAVGHMPHQTHPQEVAAAVDRAAQRAQLR